MGKSKAKPNGFLFFMLEWMKDQEKKGRSFPNGLKDVQTDPDCNEIWKSLSDDDKAYYKELAKGADTKPVKKRTGTGDLIEDIDRAVAKEKIFKDNMIEYITAMVKMANHRKDLSDLKFYLIHINYFYLDKNQMEYYPAEIAIAEISLKDGVTRIYHEIINEPVKIGYASSAKDHSEKVHQIPVEAPFGKSNYREIFNDICIFLSAGKKGGKYPPLYTVYGVEDIYAPANSVLARFAIANNKPNDFFTLYSFEDLFSIIHNVVDEPNTVQVFEPVIALIEIKKDPYGYKPGLECKYHEDVQVGTLYCSQSIVKRWFFVLCNFCCEPLGITMLPGIHMPKESILYEPLATLNYSLSSLSITNSRKADSTLSISEISYDHRKRASRRTLQDEQRRKAEANSKPFKIIDYSVDPVKKPQEIIERPLRIPHTQSAVMNFDSTDAESIDFSENSFPSIGRGAIRKKELPKVKASAGHGYTNILKS